MYIVERITCYILPVVSFQQISIYFHLTDVELLCRNAVNKSLLLLLLLISAWDLMQKEFQL